MDKIFVCWHDYDGNHVERFENVKDAEKFITPLYAKANIVETKEHVSYGTSIDLARRGSQYAKANKKHLSYGTSIDLVCRGSQLFINPVKFVSKILLTDKEVDEGDKALVTFPDGSELWTVFRRYWEGDEKKGEYILIPDNG